MGSTPLRAHGVEQALAGQPATEEAVRAAGAHAAEGTNPPSDLNGDADYRSHLADGAHPAGRARRRGGSVSPMDLNHRFTVPTVGRRDLGRVPGHRVDRRVLPRRRRSPRVEGDTFQGTCKVKLGPIALVYAGSGTFVDKDEASHSFVVEAKGKDKRGNGTAGATVTADHGRRPRAARTSRSTPTCPSPASRRSSAAA